MTPAILAALITTGVPLLTGLVKKLLKTDAMPDAKAATVHQMLPLGIGLAASVLACASGACTGDGCPASPDWIQCILYGLAYGAGGSYLRDFDSNITRVAAAAAKLTAKKTDAPQG